MAETILTQYHRADFTHHPAYLSRAQSRADALVSSFVDHATDGYALAGMVGGGLVYRLGRVGTLALASRLFPSSSSLLTPYALRLTSIGIGFTGEVFTFEAGQRALRVGIGGADPNLLHWSGENGLGRGLVSAAITLGSLKGTGAFVNGQNPILQHLFQDSAMVLAHNVHDRIFTRRGDSRIAPTFAEQFVEAEATLWQMNAGMALVHGTFPRLGQVERSLDLSARSGVGAALRGRPIFGGTHREVPLPSFNEPLLSTAASGERSFSSNEGPSRDHLIFSVGHGESTAADRPRVADFLRPSPLIIFTPTRAEGKGRALDFRITSLTGGTFAKATGNSYLADHGYVTPEITFPVRHPLIADLIQEVMDKNPGTVVIQGVEKIQFTTLPRLGHEYQVMLTPRVMERPAQPTTVILSGEFADTGGEKIGSSRTFLTLLPAGTVLPEAPLIDPAGLGEAIVTYEVPTNLTERYRKVSGDHNPAHQGPEAIVHGMATMQLAHAAYRRSRGEHPIRPFGMEAKFTGAVRAGDTLRFFKEVGDGVETILVLNQRNQQVMALEIKEEEPEPAGKPE